MKWQALAVLLLLATAAVLPSRAEEEAEVDDDEEEFDEERAVVLVRRALADERPLEGKQTTVTISLYNAGNTPAKNIKIEEVEWPADSFAVEGELAASFDSIPVGASVQHTYKIAGKQPGMYQHAPTKVTYIPGEGEAAQTATGETLVFRTFTFGESMTAKALEWGSWASGGRLNTINDWKYLAFGLGALGVALVGYRTYGSASEAQKNRRRAKALRDLGESEKDK